MAPERNLYPGRCPACGNKVRANEGVLGLVNSQYRAFCLEHGPKMAVREAPLGQETQRESQQSAWDRNTYEQKMSHFEHYGSLPLGVTRF